MAQISPPRPFVLALVVTFAFVTAGIRSASAHAVAGMRVFPATLSFDDPGVVSEWPLQISRQSGVTTLSSALAKTLTPTLGFSIANHFSGGSGLPWQADDWTLAVAYQLFRDDDHESIAMVQLGDHIGRTGGASADTYSTYTPEFAFGKGFGDLSDRHRYWRPLAVTGAFSENLPSIAGVPRTANWSLSVQYSLPYLENFVRDVGLTGVAHNLVPIVEFPMQTCLDAVCGHETTGSVNPGVIWVGHDLQWGVEAMFPTGSTNHRGIGVIFGVDLYLDDISPQRFGRPLFDGNA